MGEHRRCMGTSKTGARCTGPATSTGYCIAHDPRRHEWNIIGGQHSRKGERLAKLLPSSMRPIIDLLNKAAQEVYDGRLDPRQATALASLASALVRVYTVGEMEDRMRQVEAKVNKKQDDEAHAWGVR